MIDRLNQGEYATGYQFASRHGARTFFLLFAQLAAWWFICGDPTFIKSIEPIIYTTHQYFDDVLGMRIACSDMGDE